MRNVDKQDKQVICLDVHVMGLACFEVVKETVIRCLLTQFFRVDFMDFFKL